MNHGRQQRDSARISGHRGRGPRPGRSRSRGDGGLRSRRRIRTYRRQEGATPLLTSAQETGETRSVFILQSTRRVQPAHFCGLNLFLNGVSWGLVAIVYKMQAQQRKPLLHLIFFLHFFFACTEQLLRWRKKSNILNDVVTVFVQELRQWLPPAASCLCGVTVVLAGWGVGERKHWLGTDTWE